MPSRGISRLCDGLEARESLSLPVAETRDVRYAVMPVPVSTGRPLFRITDKIVAELEAGRVPWCSPGDRQCQRAAWPAAQCGDRPAYSGRERAHSVGCRRAARFAVQRWLTFRQALSPAHMSAKARPAPPSSMPIASPPMTSGEARADGEAARAIPFLKRFTVFNCQQCDDLPEALTVTPPPFAPISSCRRSTLSSVRRASTSGSAATAPSMPGPDYVQVPPPEAYFEPINWHRTALHECSMPVVILPA